MKPPTNTVPSTKRPPPTVAGETIEESRFVGSASETTLGLSSELASLWVELAVLSLVALSCVLEEAVLLEVGAVPLEIDTL